MMQIIPVIDLKNGLVVHAKRGERQNYQPIQSALTSSVAPADIIDVLLELYPFEQIYIADIDAIQGNGSHYDLVERLSAQYRNTIFWLDCGIQQMNHRALHADNIRPVIGSENMHHLISYKAVSYACASRHVLSLDFRNDMQLGTKELFETARYWPDDTICMSLTHVGSEQGIDLNKLNSLIQLNAQRKSPGRLYAAGGIRNVQDCLQLKQMGIAGALVATALHNKTITHDDIQKIHNL